MESDTLQNEISELESENSFLKKDIRNLNLEIKALKEHNEKLKKIIDTYKVKEDEQIEEKLSLTFKIEESEEKLDKLKNVVDEVMLRLNDSLDIIHEH
jgi:chromosome segregation ATPase